MSVCVSVCHQDCDKMAGFSITVLSEVIALDNSLKIQHCQDDLLTGSGSYGSCIKNHIMAYNLKTYERIHTKFHQYVV